jgi:hypothetical protein
VGDANASLARALEVGTQREIEFWREVLGLYKQIHRLHELQTNAARVDDRTRCSDEGVRIRVLLQEKMAAKPGGR